VDRGTAVVVRLREGSRGERIKGARGREGRADKGPAWDREKREGLRDSALVKSQMPTLVTCGPGNSPLRPARGGGLQHQEGPGLVN
jgi:hypothetical protein